MVSWKDVADIILQLNHRISRQSEAEKISRKAISPRNAVSEMCDAIASMVSIAKRAWKMSFALYHQGVTFIPAAPICTSRRNIRSNRASQTPKKCGIPRLRE
jgi:hypothetical protein